MNAVVNPHTSSLFSNFAPAAEDPIFTLLRQFRADTNPQKIDLGIGVYRDENNESPILKSVKQAEEFKLTTEMDKSYVGPMGDAQYIATIQQLIFTPEFLASNSQRLAAMQTPGGSCALRMAFELIASDHKEATIWLSNPTWQVHQPLIKACNLQTEDYPYYDQENHSVAFDQMLETLSHAAAKDIVLIQASCHNPTGCDLSTEQWQKLAKFLQERDLIPLIDIAYHGLGNGLIEDAAGLNIVAKQVPEMIVTYTCSKNFGLYRDRAGALLVLNDNPQDTAAIQQHLIRIAIELYFTPPAHPSTVVTIIRNNQELDTLWQQELKIIRDRINGTRSQLSHRLSAVGIDADYIATQRGIFSLLNFSPAQFAALREQDSIYIPDNGRINIAGINPQNIDHFVDSLAKL